MSRITPSVTASHLTSEGDENGIGATLHCDLPMMGATTEERVVRFDEGKALGVEIYETTKVPVIRDPHALFTMEDDGDGTLLAVTSTYDVGMGPIGAAMNSLMISKRFERGWRMFLAGVKHHVETGESVERDTAVPVTAVTATAAAA